MIWIVSHDAGGAEILSSWIAREKMATTVRCVLEGPAASIFAKKIPGLAPIPSREQFMRDLRPGDQVITGSGWASDLEFLAILTARERAIPVSAWIDHWVNYPRRFERNGQKAFPDELWVCDDFQKKIAEAELPPMKIVLRENPYFRDIQNRWKSLQFSRKLSAEQTRWLYIGEAISEAKPERRELPPEQLPEIRCLQRLLAKVKQFGENSSLVRIRPHPAETREKYQSTLNANTVNWEWAPGGELIEDCAWADEVVGIGSMGLVIALLGNKSVTSIQLEPGWICPIPLPGIKNIPL